MDAGSSCGSVLDLVGIRETESGELFERTLRGEYEVLLDYFFINFKHFLLFN